MKRTTLVSNDHQLDADSPIKEFYRGKVIFLTGATGVLGELFVEKLLRFDGSDCDML